MDNLKLEACLKLLEYDALFLCHKLLNLPSPLSTTTTHQDN